MSRRLKLRYQMLVAYSIPLVLFVITGIIVDRNVRVAEQQSELAGEAATTMLGIKEWQYDVAVMQRSARGYILVKNETSKSSFLEAEENFKRHTKELERRAMAPEQKERLKVILDEGLKLNQYAVNFITLVDEGRLNEAKKIFGQKAGILRGAELKRLMFDFEKVEQRLLDQRLSEEKAAQGRLKSAVFWGAALSVVVTLTIGMLVSLRISKVIAETSTNIASSSAEISATVAQHERTANQQAAMVNETTSTVEELGASSRQSSEQATNAAAVAQQASSTTEEGRNAVKQAIESMTLLKDKVGAVADQILRLGEQTAQIGNLANLVKDLSTQTNMLALNAAVEAARAGEHGKGFAVVASEVRKLADESKKSAEQANMIVADIQKATNSSIMVTEEGQKTVEQITALAGKVGELFSNLSTAASSVYENAQQVLLNTKQQAAALNQVITAINSINTASRETAAGISQTKIGVQKLNEAAQNLKAAV